MSDGSLSDTGQVTINVTAVNDAPVAGNDTATAVAGTAVNIAVLANDSDIENSPLTPSVVTGPAHGTLALNADKTYTYTADATYSGPDSFTYKVNDGALDSNTATVAITVTPVADSTAPEVSVNRAAGQPDSTSTGPIQFTVTFTEPVTGFDASDVKFAGSTAGGPLVAEVTGGSTVYTVSVTGMNTTGTVVINLLNGAATDAAGNPSTASTAIDNTVAWTQAGDTTAPTAAVTLANGQAATTSNAPVNFTVTFSEPVTDFGADDISFTGTTAGGTPVALVTTNGPSVYNVTVYGMTSSGAVVVSVPANATRDAAGNFSTASNTATVNYTFVATNVAPVVTVTKLGPQPSPTGSEPISFGITFSEDITGFELSDISFAGSTAGGTLVPVVTPVVPGRTYTVSVTGMTTAGDVVMGLPAGAVQDPDGKRQRRLEQSDRRLGRHRPGRDGDTGGRANRPHQRVIGRVHRDLHRTRHRIRRHDIDTSASTAGGTLVANVTETDPTTYTVAVTGMTSQGTVAISIAGGKAADAAGNLSTATTPAKHRHRQLRRRPDRTPA